MGNAARKLTPVTHENLVSDEPLKSGSDRSFGFVFAGVFGAIAVLPLLKHHPMRTWALAPSLVFLLIAVAKPQLLATLNRAWFMLSLFLGKLVTPVWMGIFFFLVITPVGVIKRLFGGDALRLRFDKAARSYWIDRNPPGPDPKTMSNPF